MKKFFVIYPALCIGGIETILVKICEWCNQNDDYQFYWIRPSKFSASEDLLTRMRSSGCVEVDMIHTFPNLKVGGGTYANIEHISTIMTEDVIIILTFGYWEFLLGEKIRGKYINKVKAITNIYYVPHEYMYEDILYYNRIKIVGRLYWHLYRKLACKMVNNNNFIFMGPKFAQKIFVDHYNLHYHPEELPYINIPTNTQYVSLEEIMKRHKNKKRKICVIGRADFPFKGYIIGAIDSYVKLRKKGYNVCLYIISYGNGEALIKNKIKSISSEYQRDIFFLGKVDYIKLIDIIKNMYVCISSGSTLLDISACYVPGLIGTVYQYEDKGRGILFESTDCTVAYDTTEAMSDALVRVLDMDISSYLTLCKNINMRFREKFDIDMIVPSFFKIRNENILDNWIDRIIIIYWNNILHQLYRLLRKIVKR